MSLLAAWVIVGGALCVPALVYRAVGGLPRFHRNFDFGLKVEATATVAAVVGCIILLLSPIPAIVSLL